MKQQRYNETGAARRIAGCLFGVGGGGEGPRKGARQDRVTEVLIRKCWHALICDGGGDFFGLGTPISS